MSHENLGIFKYSLLEPFIEIALAKRLIQYVEHYWCVMHMVSESFIHFQFNLVSVLNVLDIEVLFYVAFEWSGFNFF